MDTGLVYRFEVKAKVSTPIVVGQDDIEGRRQLIPIEGGTVSGAAPDGSPVNGELLGGGVDSQVIRPNGRCELSARYGVKLDNGQSFYIENNGIRTVPAEYVSKVLNGEFIDPDLYYFCTQPTFEIYHKDLNWLKERLFICKAKRFPDSVALSYFEVQ